MKNEVFVPVSDLISAVVEGNEEEFIGKITVSIVCNENTAASFCTCADGER